MKSTVIGVIVAFLAIAGIGAFALNADSSAEQTETTNTTPTITPAPTEEAQDEADPEETQAPTPSATATPSALPSSIPTDTPASESAATPTPQPAGQYIDYAPGVIENTSGSKIVFFHADWCPRCNALEADILSSGVPSGVTIIKANYDDEKDLKERYGVTFQTTTVLVDDSGNLLQSHYAGGNPTVADVVSSLGL